NIQDTYHHRSLYPTAVFQDLSDEQMGGGGGGKGSSDGGPDSVNFQKIATDVIKGLKADEITSQGLRGASTVAEKHIEHWVNKFQEAQNSSKLSRQQMPGDGRGG